MMKRTLTERLNYNDAGLQLLTEETSSGKSLFLKGIFIEGDVRNHNKRVYPINEIRRAVETINESLRRGESVLGEADHPEELNINLDRVSHCITEMWLDGHKGMGKLKILPTPMGNICRALLENDVKLGVSSRGSGNVDANGRVSDFEIITVDIVAKPSAPHAFPTAIYEAYNMPGRSGVIMEDLALAVTHGDPVAQKYLSNKILEFIQKL